MKQSFGRFSGMAHLLLAFLGTGCLIAGAWKADKALAAESQIQQSDTAIECHGMVKAAQQYQLTLNPGESIQQIHVQSGQEVQAGDLLVTLNNDPMMTALADLVLKQNALQEAKRELLLLNLELRQKEKRLNALNKRIRSGRQLMKRIPTPSAERELDPLLIQQKDQQEKIELLKVRIQLAQTQERHSRELASLMGERIQNIRQKIKYLNVKAPFAGTVGKVCRYPQRASAGQTVLALSDRQHLLIEASVLQHQLKYIQVGDRAAVYLDFGKYAPLDATVDRILPNDATPGGDVYPSFMVILEIHRLQSWVRPGMKVRVRLGDKVPS